MLKCLKHLRRIPRFGRRLLETYSLRSYSTEISICCPFPVWWWCVGVGLWTSTHFSELKVIQYEKLWNLNNICSSVDSIVSVSIACFEIVLWLYKMLPLGEAGWRVHLYSTIFVIFSESIIISEFKSKKVIWKQSSSTCKEGVQPD